MRHRFWNCKNKCQRLLSIILPKRKKAGSDEYLRVMRLRQIWAEGTFAALKQEHKLNKIQKRDIHEATEECLLSATE